jgi:hypothetical protein
VFFGSLGTVMRYGLQGLVQDLTGTQFPAGTLAVNLAGLLSARWPGPIVADPIEKVRVILYRAATK